MLKKMVGDFHLRLIFLTATLSQISPPTHSEGYYYRSVQWKRAKEGFVDIPSLTQHGWVVEDTHIEPVWSEGPILPNGLVDVLAGGQENSDDDYISDDEPDFDVAFSSNDNDDD